MALGSEVPVPAGSGLQSLPSFPTELANLSVSARHVQPPGAMLWPAPAAPPREPRTLGWHAPRPSQDPRPQPHRGAGEESGLFLLGCFALWEVQAGIPTSAVSTGAHITLPPLTLRMSQWVWGWEGAPTVCQTPPHPGSVILSQCHPWVQDYDPIY